MIPAGRGARLALLGGLVLLLASWWAWNARDAVQVPAAFAALAEAVADGDAGDVVACVHPDYDWQRTWPEIAARQGELRTALGGSNDPELDRPRGLARAGLRRLFALHIVNRLELTWRLQSWRALPDGSIEAVVDLGLDAPQGSLATIRPMATGLRFTLKRYGLSPRLRILAHDPLPVRVPTISLNRSLGPPPR